MATLPKNISMLSDVEKFELLDAIWSDLETHPSALSTAQSEELDARVAAYEQDRSAVVAWDLVKAAQPKL